MDLIGREIFAVGKWNGIEFSEEDLDDIVANFERLEDTHKVPLKFGHNDEQPITDGQPAIGWVQRVYREGQKLLADFANVPSTVVQAIKNKLYRSVSVELLFNVDTKGTKFDHVLDAVAILGADHPAVNSLADLDMLLATRTVFSGGHRVTFSVIEGNQTMENELEDFDMDEKQIKALIDKAVAPLQESNKKLEEKNAHLEAELSASREKEKEREREVMSEKVSSKRNEIKALLDGSVRDQHMTPAIREVYSKQIGLDDDDKVLDIDVAAVKLMCGSIKSVDDDDKAFHKGRNDILDGDPADVLIAMTKDYQAQHNERDFRAAFTRVIETNPQLHQEYLDSNGEK